MRDLALSDIAMLGLPVVFHLGILNQELIKNVKFVVVKIDTNSTNVSRSVLS